jgi:hypothetical protein
VVRAALRKELRGADHDSSLAPGQSWARRTYDEKANRRHGAAVSGEMYDWARRRDTGMIAFLAGALAGLFALFLVFLLPFLARSDAALRLPEPQGYAVLIAAPLIGALIRPVAVLSRRLRPGAGPRPAAAGAGPPWLAGCLVAYGVSAVAGLLLVSIWLKNLTW